MSERLEDLLEALNIETEEVQIAANELAEKIEEQWQSLGSYSDAEVQIMDASGLVCDSTYDEVDPQVVALAYCLGVACNGHDRSDVVEVFSLLREQDEFSEAVQWFDDNIGHDFRDSLQLYVVVNAQVA